MRQVVRNTLKVRISNERTDELNVDVVGLR